MKILCLILTFFAVTFCGYEDEYSIIAKQQIEKFDFAIISEEIIDSFETGDTTVIESYMCKSIKENTTDLSGEIKNVINALPGDIVNWNCDSSPGYSGSTQDGKGGLLQTKGLVIIINTTVGKYQLNFLWDYVNTCYPEETGIRSIALIDPLDCTTLDENNCAILKAMVSIESNDPPYVNPNPLTIKEENQKLITYIKEYFRGNK